MKSRYNEEGRKLDQIGLVQTYRGQNLFLFSELIKFYLELGYEIRNVKLATQYLGEKCFAKFIKEVVDMRVEATGKDETKANTAKIIGNSSYGKLLENPMRHSRALLVEDRLLKRYVRKPTITSWHSLETEAGNIDLNEVVMEKKHIEDSYPVHVGNAVLQHSKLHFLR